MVYLFVFQDQAWSLTPKAVLTSPARQPPCAAGAVARHVRLCCCVLVLLVRVHRSAAMTAGSVSTLMGPWGTNNYELCCQQGTSNHSRTFHNSWAPATMFVLNTPAAGQLTQRRLKELWITIETCLHNPQAQLHAVFCAIDVPGGKNRPGWKRKWQLPWMLRVVQWLIHGSREAEQPEAKRTTFGQTENKTVKMLSNLKLTSSYRAELKIPNGLRCAPLGRKKGLFDSRSNSATVDVWI